MARKQDANFNEYMERLRDPALKNQSSGLSGVLGASGGGGPSPYFNNAMGSLPDLKQSKRESKLTISFLLNFIHTSCNV